MQGYTRAMWLDETGIPWTKPSPNALHADQLVWNDAALDRLAATPRLEAMIVGGERPEAIFRAWEPEVDTFRRQAVPYFIYP